MPLMTMNLDSSNCPEWL